MMKKRHLIILAAYGLALILSGCSARTSEALDVTDVSAEEIASPLSVENGGGLDEELAPALTPADIRTASVSDLSDGDERADYIHYVVYRDFMRVDSEGRFRPEEFVTRGELMNVLLHMSDQEAPEYDGEFSDVAKDSPWAEAISWAVQAGIAAESADGMFFPQAVVNREQLAMFLYRLAADAATVENTVNIYRDGGQVEENARTPLAWVLGHGLFAGMVSDTIYPALSVSRAQLAQVLTAYAASVEKEPLAQTLVGQFELKQVESVSRLRHDEIQKQIDSIAAKYSAMGLQVAVVEDGEVTDSFSCGWAVKDVTPMTSDHKIRSASITKVAVGMSAMILNEEGVINLDESIGAYWGVSAKNPSYPDIPVSIRTLLSHSSSLKVFSWEVSRSRDNVRSILQSGNSYMKSAPGSSGAWGYNNYVFGVLGQTLELASGKYLDEIMDERIWSIMGIDSAFESGSITDTDKLATLYENGKVYTSHSGLLKNIRPSTLGASGDNYSGGMTISAVDLAKMAALLANDGWYEGLRLLSEESVALMESDSGISASDGIPQAYPLRWRNGLYGRDKLYYHTGSGYGVYNLLSYDPVTKDAVVVLTTGASGSKDSTGIYAVCGEISQYIYNIIK